MSKRTSSKPRHEKPRRSARPSSHASSATTRMASSSSSAAPSHEYALPGPHDSLSVRAVAGSPYLHARRDSYVLREPAYIKHVCSAAHQSVAMAFELRPGLLLRPNVRQPRVQYPDGTFLHSVPVSDVTVLSMSSVYRHGRGREFINAPSEVYGRDSVLIVMRSMVLEKLKRHVARLYEHHYPDDSMFSFGQREQAHPEISFVPCTVRRAANFIVRARETVVERRIDRVLASGTRDLCGDALVAMKYVRNIPKRSAELVFELEDVIIRRGGEHLLE